jgi:hypothetical protein
VLYRYHESLLLRKQVPAYSVCYQSVHHTGYRRGCHDIYPARDQGLVRDTQQAGVHAAKLALPGGVDNTLHPHCYGSLPGLETRDGASVYKTTAIIYSIQLLLNFLWSIVFFGMHQVFGGLIIIVLLLVFIILNIAWFGRFTKTAAWLLVPYLVWVSYATLLNIGIYILNK